MKSLQKNQKGFTLVELMIVVAIIGILAAIAIPQFNQYRIRARNATVKAVVNVTKNAQSDLNAELGCYGHTEATAQLLTDADGGPGVLDSDTTPALALAATATTAGARLVGTNPVRNNTVFAVPVNPGNGMSLDVQDSAPAVGTQASYVIYVRHNTGDTAYAVDSDAPATLYSISDATWVGAGVGIQATVYAPTTPANDIAGQPGGNTLNGNWEQIAQ